MKPIIALRSFLPLGLVALNAPAADAAAIITSGQTVGGTTTNISLTATTPTINDPDSTVTKSAGSLAFAVKETTTDTDWWLQFNSLSIDTNIYRYVQIMFSSVTAGAVNAGWQTFFADGDSTIGGGSNSGHSIGTGVVGTVPFAVVIDMVAFTGLSGGSTGATGWGAAGAGSDIVTSLRFDLFEGNAANRGKTFTISEVKLGSALIPEPSAALLGGIGALCLLRRRRN